MLGIKTFGTTTEKNTLNNTMNKAKEALQNQIKEAQVNLSWAEHKGLYEERRKWSDHLRELRALQDGGKRK